MSDEESISNAIIRLAEERMKVEPYQNINSAVHGVVMIIKQYIMIYMNDHKNEGR